MRHRRRLAAPFVVTAVLSPACASETPPPAAPASAGPAPTANPDPASATEPMPAPIAGPAQEAAPTGPGTWTQRSESSWSYAYDGGGILWVNGEECRYSPPAPKCPPGTICNPPPPRTVACTLAPPAPRDR